MRVILVLLLLAACAGEPPAPRAERTDSAGITIVTSEPDTRELEWTARETFRVGGSDEGPESFFRVEGNDVAADAAGRLYVLDVGNLQVHVFDEDGRHVRTMAREGEGPGELSRPVRIFVEGDGTVNVLESTKRALIRFAPDGSYLEDVRIRDLAGSVSNQSVFLPEHGMVVPQTEVPGGFEGFGVGDPYVFRIQYVERMSEQDGWAEPEPMAATEIIQQSYAEVGRPDCEFQIATPPIFAFEPVWSASDGHVLFNGWKEYRLDVIDVEGGRTSVRRAIPPVVATRALAADEIGDFTPEEVGPQCVQTGEERADQAGWAERIPWITGVTRSPSGRVFVERRAPDEEARRRIDVFDADGGYLGTLPDHIPFPDGWRREGEMIRLEGDELGRQYVVVYEVVDG